MQKQRSAENHNRKARELRQEAKDLLVSTAKAGIDHAEAHRGRSPVRIRSRSPRRQPRCVSPIVRRPDPGMTSTTRVFKSPSPMRIRGSAGGNPTVAASVAKSKSRAGPRPPAGSPPRHLLSPEVQRQVRSRRESKDMVYCLRSPDPERARAPEKQAEPPKVQPKGLMSKEEQRKIRCENPACDKCIHRTKQKCQKAGYCCVKCQNHRARAEAFWQRNGTSEILQHGGDCELVTYQDDADNRC